MNNWSTKIKSQWLKTKKRFSKNKDAGETGTASTEGREVVHLNEELLANSDTLEKEKVVAEKKPTKNKKAQNSSEQEREAIANSNNSETKIKKTNSSTQRREVVHLKEELLTPSDNSIIMMKEIDKEHVFNIKELNFFYNNGQKQALFGINLDIDRNRVTAFIGPSGCGKSTLLRTLNRMNDLIEGIKVQGQILFNSQNIYESKKNIITLRTKVGMVFQKANPFPMSIYDNIAYGPKNQGIKNRKILNQIVEDSLKQAALWEEVKEHLHDSALSLSGGQQQRLCIARALALKPEVLLMDEPTSALDPIASAKIEDLINKLKKDYTIIIVTHSMQQAARISYKTAFFLNGELIEYDLTKKLFSRPKNKKTEDYITGRFG